MYGNHGKVMHIYLDQKKYGEEIIPEKIYEKYIGGKGLGTYLLKREVNPKVDPLSPDNKLIFCTGPLTGTTMQAVSRYGVFTKSPQTGIYVESYSGGYVAPKMKATGYDGFILHGTLTSPGYLVITEKGIEFKNADHLWGKETYETEDRIIEEVGVKGSQAIVIGPAGENLVVFSGITNNYWRHAGRAGVGAVMGSKKLKAMVFYGNIKTKAAEEGKFDRIVSEFVKKAKEDQGIKNYQKYGTPQLVALVNSYGAFPTRYWQKGEKDNWENISASYIVEKMDAKPRACHRCMIACGKFSTVKKGKRQGLKIEGPEYETIYSFGGLCEIDQLEEIAYLNDICDRLGLDTISTGNVVGLAIEATERGRLYTDLEYGNADRIADLIKDISCRRGIGDILAMGIKDASQELGLNDLAIHVKGLEPAGYDPRILRGMGLAYATSPRGACHLRATVYKAELSGMHEFSTNDGEVKVLIDFENHHIIQDTGIICRFTRDLTPINFLVDLYSSVTGYNYSENKFKQITNNILSEIRNFNLSTGMETGADTLPDRFFDEPLPPKNQTITREELSRMLTGYYSIRGWDENGIPKNN
jgi:aldehyde:ferredoxin oxidoreductase